MSPRKRIPRDKRLAETVRRIVKQLGEDLRKLGAHKPSSKHRRDDRDGR